MTVEIEMSDEEFKTVSNYAAENNFSVPEFFLNLARAKINCEEISDAELIKISADLIKERAEVYEALAQ